MKVAVAENTETTTIWHRCGEFPKLSDGIVHLWHLTLPKQQPLESYAPLITAEEVNRAKLFKREIDALRFALGRIGLRTLLANYFDIAPLKVRLVLNRFGKPLATRLNVHFNISHSGDSILWAFSRSYELGIDVENTPIKQVEEFRSFFSEQEMGYLVAQPNDQRIRAFHRLWVRKEACLKAAGCGFSLDPRLVEVLPDEVLLPVAPELSVQRLYLHDVITPSCETAAVAISAPCQTIHFLDLSSFSVSFQ